MTPPLRCALLSTAHVHAAVYANVLLRSDVATLAAIWDDDPARQAAASEQYGVPVEPSLDTVLARPDVEAVIITAENTRHRVLCEAACTAGKHVLCEKPLATTAEDAAAMIAAAHAAGVTLATAFPMRHNGPARRVREQLQAGSIGPVLAVRASNHGQVPPGWFLDPALSGGGAIMDHTVHVLDLLRWFLNDEPEEVYAEASHGLYKLAVEDAGFMTIIFRSGVVVTLDPSWSRPSSYPTWGDVTMEIAGERGTLQLDALAEKNILYAHPGQRTEWLPWGLDADHAMIEDFARAVREGRPPAASARDGERALAVALAAYASVQSGQPAPVAPPAR